MEYYRRAHHSLMGVLDLLNESEQSGFSYLAAHPDLQINIHFSRHDQPSDFGSREQFEDKIAAADLYVKEDTGYHRDINQGILDVLSERRIPADLLPQVLAAVPAADARKAAATYHTGTKTISADIHSEHWLAAPGYDPNSIVPVLEDLCSPPMDQQSAQKAAAMIRRLGYTLNMREWVILTDFGNKVADLAAADETVNNKIEDGSYKVFMSYGNAHTGLFFKLRQLGLRPTRSFPERPVQYPPLLAAIRKSIFQSSGLLAKE